MVTKQQQTAPQPATPTKVLVSAGSSGDWSGGEGLLPGREALGPLFLMAVTPPFVIVFYYICTHMDGNVQAFAALIMQDGFLSTMYSIWPSPTDPHAWAMILSFFAVQLLLMKTVPGKSFTATLTAKGNTPVYTANGLQCYLITLAALLSLTYMGFLHPAVVYDKFGNILASLNVFAFFFCTMLLIKGHVAPSSTDSGTNGSIVQDFYWGMELYPRILGWDVKMFTNCRAGMMFWAVGICCFAYKNAQLNNGVLQLGMAVNVSLQLIYITKFFYWEMGYMCSMDIQHDRAGYYLCWGCLVWVPSIYTSTSLYLTEHAPPLTPLQALTIFCCGFVMIFINYDSDHQRYVFRQTKGQCSIWLSTSVPKHIVATYSTTNTSATPNKVQQSLLLVDGYWKISRHFHYVPEVLASLCWSAPALDTAFFLPYFYVIYLSILLLDRAHRDDDRCLKKYGKYWEEYCHFVPYKIIPGVV